MTVDAGREQRGVKHLPSVGETLFLQNPPIDAGEFLVHEPACYKALRFLGESVAGDNEILDCLPGVVEDDEDVGMQRINLGVSNREDIFSPDRFYLNRERTLGSGIKRQEVYCFCVAERQ